MGRFFYSCMLCSTTWNKRHGVFMKVKKINLCAAMIFFSTTVAADFKVDMDGEEIYKKLGMFTVGDLGVGESGFVRVGLLCTNKDTISIPNDTRLENDKSEFGTYWKLKRLPNNRVALEIIPAKSDSKKDAVTLFLTLLGGKNTLLSCDSIKSLYRYDESDFFVISSIEEIESVKVLLDSVN